MKELLEATEVDKAFPKAALLSFVVYLCLLICVYSLAPASSFSQLEGLEAQVPATAATILSVSLAMYCIPCLRIIGRWRRRPSGVMVGAITVVTIAISTNLLLGFFPTVVMVDPVTGARVFLARWCEWVPLSGMMTFMSDAVDVPKKRGGFREAYRCSLMQAVSTLCGLIFPFCSNFMVWASVFILSFATYLPIFPRTQWKQRMLAETPRGVTFMERELWDRRKFAFNLLSMCAVVWTLLVVFYILNMLIHQLVPEDEGYWIRDPAIAMAFDTTFDVIAKGLYLKVIVEVHHNVFDIDSRIYRQCQELRQLLTVVWDSSTDVIFVSVRGKGKASSLISPGFAPLVGHGHSSVNSAAGVMIETEDNEFMTMKPTAAHYVDSELITSAEDSLLIGSIDLQSRLVEVGTDLVNACWDRLANNLKEKTSVLLLFDFLLPDGSTCNCEIKVSRRSPESLVAIVRDVTERRRRFNAEQQAHEASLARQKDAQTANRFTRHEIKNRLLSGFELCDELQKTVKDVGSSAERIFSTVHAEESEKKSLEAGLARTTGMIGQLNGVLRGVLELEIAEAMARDVIHDCYQLAPHKVDLEKVLESTCLTMGNPQQFRVDAQAPILLVDEVMLHYIHRNALSNAQKYGRSGGPVWTRARYDEIGSTLFLEVENEPGRGHELFLSMGEESNDLIFEQGSRFHHDDESDPASGDGAWMMQKCASVMGGSCAIRFEEHKTVLSLKCPALKFEPDEADRSATLEIPESTWGLGIDDSAFQRKILLRLLAEAGISKSRRRVIGGSPEEIRNLEDTIAAMLDEDPNSKVLVLCDENLDFVVSNGQRILISGSRELEKILVKMPPTRRDRMLVLIRSANDSASDISTYCERSHGFFPKNVTKKNAVIELLEPHWQKRFGNQPNSPQHSSLNVENLEDNELLTRQDLRVILSSVDELLQSRPLHVIPWRHLWSALHSMKGDIMMSENEHLVRAVQRINEMKDGSTTPEDFLERWLVIRATVMDAVQELKS